MTGDEDIHEGRICDASDGGEDCGAWATRAFRGKLDTDWPGAIARVCDDHEPHPPEDWELVTIDDDEGSDTCHECNNKPDRATATAVELFVDDHEIGAYASLNYMFCSTECWQVWMSTAVHDVLARMDEVVK